MLEKLENPAPRSGGSRVDVQADTEFSETTARLQESGWDLTNEWGAAATAATCVDFDALIGSGVPKRWLWGGPMRFGVASIATSDDGAYQPDPDGRHAFIVPAIPVSVDALFEDCDPVDLVAFRLAEHGRWWRRLDVVPFLNPGAVERADYFGETLQLWRTPLAWLRAQGQGAVILDPVANLRLWLGGVREIVTEDVAHGDLIERRLILPTPQARVLVREEA
jgi:hypothetical protein